MNAITNIINVIIHAAKILIDLYRFEIPKFSHIKFEGFSALVANRNF